MKALITGASGGIGSAVAELLRQNGYEILTLSSRFEDTDALAKECRALTAACEIDALILCAGTAKFAPLEAMSESEILKILNVNLAGNIIITRALLPNLKRNRAADTAACARDQCFHLFSFKFLCRFDALSLARRVNFTALNFLCSLCSPLNLRGLFKPRRDFVG